MTDIIDHSIARELFLEIRERPYQVSTRPFVPANNCFFKNSDLLVGLGQLGYEVRGRTAEMLWSEIIPEDIRKLADNKHDNLHFFIEVKMSDGWMRLDASFNQNMEKHGFRVYGFQHSEETCFDLTRILTQKEVLLMQEKWRSLEYVESYFNDNARFLAALNEWFSSVN